MLAAVEPVLHNKVDAPVTVSVVDPPAQMAEGDAAIERLGAVLTTTVALAVDEHPLVVPVTE